MAPDERSRMEVTQALTDQLGSAAAAALLECVPPFGWHEIATKSDLHALEARLDERMQLRFEALEARLDAKFQTVDARFRAVDAKFDAVDARFGELGATLDSRLRAEMTRSIRWTVGAVFGGLSVVAGAATGIAAIVT